WEPKRNQKLSVSVLFSPKIELLLLRKSAPGLAMWRDKNPRPVPDGGHRSGGGENNQPRILLGTFRQDTSLRTSSWIARFPQTWHPATSGVFCGEESAMQAVRMLLDRQDFRATTIVPSDAPDLVRGHVSLPVARGVPGLSSPAVG